MSAQRVLYIHAGRCTVYLWSDGHFVEGPTFVEGDAGIASLVALVSEAPDVSTAVLADVVEEEHHRETVPKLGRYDLQAMVKRRVARSYVRTPYRNGAVLKEDTGEPDSVYIRLSGITRPQSIKIWTDALKPLQVPIVGVYTPSLLSLKLLKLVRDDDAKATLIATRHSDGRVRHTYFEGGCLIGSRRFRQYTDNRLSDAEFVVRQVESTLRHFKTAGGPAYSGYTDIVLIGDPDPEGFTDDVMDTLPACRVRGISMAAAAKGLRQKEPPSSEHCEQLFVGQLHNPSAASNFAPASEIQYGRLFQLRTRAIAALWVLAVGLLGLSAYNAFEVSTSSAAAELATMQATGIELAHRRFTETNYALDPALMQAAVNSHAHLTENRPKPQEYLSIVARALTGHPAIQIDGLSWGPHVDEDAAMNGMFDSASDRIDMRMYLEGSVAPFAGEYRLAFEQVESFLKLLNDDLRVSSARAIRMPLDVDRRSSVEGEVSARGQETEAKFEIEIKLDDRNEKI